MARAGAQGIFEGNAFDIRNNNNNHRTIREEDWSRVSANRRNCAIKRIKGGREERGGRWGEVEITDDSSSVSFHRVLMEEESRCIRLIAPLNNSSGIQINNVSRGMARLQGLLCVYTLSFLHQWFSISLF